MTTAERLTRAKADMDDVYDAGYEAGKAEGGGDNFQDMFWDEYQVNGTRTSYARAFGGLGWNDVTFKPKYNIICEGSIASIFQESKITDIKAVLDEAGLTLDISKATGGTMHFASCLTSHLPALDLRSLTNCAQMFYGCTMLEELELNNVREDLNGFNGFTHCPKLTTLRVTGTIGNSIFDLRQSSLLTNESVQSIIDCLKDLTGATAQKVLLHSSVVANLTDAQLNAVWAKNWTIE